MTTEIGRDVRNGEIVRAYRKANLVKHVGIAAVFVLLGAYLLAAGSMSISNAVGAVGVCAALATLLLYGLGLRRLRRLLGSFDAPGGVELLEEHLRNGLRVDNYVFGDEHIINLGLFPSILPVNGIERVWIHEIRMRFLVIPIRTNVFLMLRMAGGKGAAFKLSEKNKDMAGSLVSMLQRQRPAIIIGKP